jgi:hypothetical protein
MQRSAQRATDVAAQQLAAVITQVMDSIEDETVSMPVWFLPIVIAHERWLKESSKRLAATLTI